MSLVEMITWGIHIVRPAPFADPDGSRYLPILAEANRPGRCPLQPVLFAVREITALGVDPPEWCACLVPSVFSVADVHAACQPAGEPFQLLVPLGGQQQQWMSARHTRVATVGLFVPVWWDDRLPPPEDDRDVNSLFQLRLPVTEEVDSLADAKAQALHLTYIRTGTAIWPEERDRHSHPGWCKPNF